MSIFFIHGGPGFNSKPEENLLKNDFLKLDNQVYFWNEPSTKRGANPTLDFKHSLRDFELFFEGHSTSQNILIAHSFGAFTALHLDKKLLNKVSQLILISPTLDLRALDENIVSIAIQELTRQKNVEKAQELSLQRKKFSHTYDLHRFHTTLNALVSVDLLSFYWFNKGQMKDYQSYFQNEKLSQKIETPVLILFGEQDPISKKEDMEKLMANYLPNKKIIRIEDVAHYPHIENSRRVFEIIASELKA